jgi:hypothetical protein
MGDLQRQVAWTCYANVSWVHAVRGSKGETYEVKWKYQFKGDVQYAYECSCPAFKFGKGKLCKHIAAVRDLRCTWNSELDPSAQPTEVESAGITFRYCPNCGGPITAVEVMT